MTFTDEELKEEFKSQDIRVSSSARELILSSEDIEQAIEEVIANFQSRLVVTKSDVQQLDNVTFEPSKVEKEPEENRDGDEEEQEGVTDEYREKVRDNYITWVSKETANSAETFGDVSEDPFTDIEETDNLTSNRNAGNRNFELSEDVASNSTSQGDLEDFTAYFRSRYEKLSDILRERVSARPIETLDDESRYNDEVTVVGIVYDKRTTKNGNVIIELEDTTGRMKTLFSDEEEIELSQEVIEDEVIAVEGTLSDDGGIVWGDRIYFPDVSPRRTSRTADRDVKVAMISDVHFGAREMAVDKWNEFVKWIYDQDDIEYLIVAGDIIEGVGIYSGQKEQLSVSTIDKQYDLCAKAFEQLPDDLTIIITPGNHDGVPQAEPQPTFPEEYRERFPDNIHFGGNPCMVTIEGVKFLMYHGVSILPFIDAFSEGDVQKPATGMWPMLQKRHIAPMYGEGVRISPEKEDHLVIEEVPDVIHTGHVHTFDVDSYNSVKLINTGAWQHQTDYQKRLDIKPDVGICSVMNLSDLSVDLYGF